MASAVYLDEVPSQTRASSLFARNGAATGNRNADENHLFANNVRFLSMAAIIAMHTLESYPSAMRLVARPDPLFYLVQSLKFGTIGFFLVSGFLFGERIDQYSPLLYFRRRLRNVFAPWVIWFSLFAALRLVADCLHGRITGFGLTQTLTVCKSCLLDTAFWFVPNLLIALALLLVCRRYLKSAWTGLVLLLASLFYGVNIYGHWIPVLHTQAAFGFVFYLWLGAWSAWHFRALQERLARVPASVMAGLILLTLGLAMAESKLLLGLGSIDPLNTLRITNQAYSVVVVLAIVRLKRAVWPRFVDVREHTFGLYLTHTAGVALVCFALKQIHPPAALISGWQSGLTAIWVIPAMFVVVYGGCLVLVGALRSIPILRWTVGLAPQKGAAVRGGAFARHPYAMLIGGSAHKVQAISGS